MTDIELDQCRRDGALLRAIVSQQVTLRKNGKCWKGKCPFHEDSDPSFCVYPDGRFHCFGCNAGGTVFDYLMQRDRVEFGAAAEIVATERGIGRANGGARKAPGRPEPTPEAETWVPIVPPPEDAPRPPAGLLAGCTTFDYVGPDGRLLFYQRRFEKAGAKRFHQLTYGTLTKDGATVTGWHAKGPPHPFPLYRLDRLTAADPDTRVFVVEGELKCHAAERMFPDAVVTAWLNGANSVHLTDWTPLRRFRNVIWWPDADRPLPDRPHGCFIATPAFLKLFPNATVVDTAGLADTKDGFDADDLYRSDCDDPEAWLAERLRAPEINQLNDVTEKGGENPPPEPETEFPLCEPTEDAVADAFAKHYADRLAYDHTEETWFAWRQGRWLRDERSLGFHLVRRFTRTLRDRLSEPPRSLTRMAFCAAVERGARADPLLALSHEVWNTDPWLLGTPDGVVDLHSGRLMPASPSLYISRHTTVAPAPAGTPAPVWQGFLDSATQGDKDFQGFLQRLAGYVLTGDVSEEVLTFLYGPGGNGKGTFLTAVISILGGYAVSLPIEVFTAGSRMNLEYYRAQMAGARLVTASETEAQATWAEAQVKEISGNDVPVSGRHPRGRPFVFRVQAKVVIVGNHAPKLKGRSPAMERRLRVAPFTNMPAKPDLELKDKLRAEYPAILRWMIDGCLIWQRDRLGSAKVVSAATSTYFEQQDAFGRWIDERCILDRSLSLRTGILLANFNAWARENGEEPVGANAFAELIDRKDLTRVKSDGVRMVRGIGLKAPEGRNWDDY